MSVLLPPSAVPMGLGCSRLGSVGGPNPDEARALLRRALSDGVRLFDTSNIYGQGDSERLLADSLIGFDDAVIVSKAGKHLTWQRRMLLPLKSALRASTRRSVNAKHTIAAVRGKPMPTRWDSRFLMASLDGSLRRLKRERIDVFLLHSPFVEVIRTGEAIAALDAARTAGKIGSVGVSVDDPDTALACLTDDRIRVLQVPLSPGGADYAATLSRAAEAGVSVIAREILGGVSVLAAQSDPASFAQARIGELVRDPLVAVPLIGSTRIETLVASIEAAKSAIGSNLDSAEPPDGGIVGG